MVGMLGFSRRLARSQAATRDARGDLACWMPERCGVRSAETALLLASELVTNALLHTGEEEMELRATCDGVRLRVAVADSDPSPPQPVHGPDEPPRGRGRGLWLMERLAARWGSEEIPGGKRVWFEVPCASSTEGDRSCEWTIPNHLEVAPGTFVRTHQCTAEQLLAASDARLRQARQLIWESDELYSLAELRVHVGDDA